MSTKYVTPVDREEFLESKNFLLEQIAALSRVIRRQEERIKTLEAALLAARSMGK
ncbi:MAG: hypothetical protein VX529_08675 [Pseudomonadota bacterium]|nr:hypothetical protein [Pseudomonadota bacterium]